MFVSYITVVFPARPETFACRDVKALVDAGVTVSVHALRPACNQWQALLAERGLADLPVDHNGLGSSMRGLAFAARHPLIALHLLGWILACTWRRPRHLLKSVVFAPRALDIFRALRERPPDVVHLFWGHYPALVGYLVRRYLPGSVLSGFLGAYDLTSNYACGIAIARRADVVWTHARHNLAEIAALGVPPGRTRHAYRGVDVSLFADCASPKERGRIVSAGRLEPAKRMDDAIAAFGVVAARWPDARLTVFGEGPDRARLQRLAAGPEIATRVELPGHVPQRRVVAEMGRCGVFVLMTQEDGDRLANVTKEAMASRCVCVVSRTPGIDELVIDGVNGFVVPPGDVAAAAAAIDWIFRHPDRADAMGIAARRHVFEHFDVVRSMKAYRDCWMELVQHRRAVPSAGVEPSFSDTAPTGPTPWMHRF